MPGTGAAWVARQGGIDADPVQQERLEAIARRLTSGHPDLRVNVRVLNSDAVCAYALPNGTLFATRGLLNRTNDDVVAAALAHEFGHLLGDGHVRPVVSLRGCDEDLGAEGRADAYGIELLRVQHLPPESMIDMLCLVRNSNVLPAGCVRAMDQRIEFLRAQLHQN